MAELIYGAARTFLSRISIHPWDEAAAEAHARVRAEAKRLGRSAGTFDIMIAAHAEALGLTLVTSECGHQAFKERGVIRMRIGLRAWTSSGAYPAHHFVSPEF